MSRRDRAGAQPRASAAKKPTDAAARGTTGKPAVAALEPTVVHWMPIASERAKPASGQVEIRAASAHTCALAAAVADTARPSHPGVSKHDEAKANAGADPLSAVGLRAGDLVDRTYRVERALGVGGMGVVALAVDERLDRKVAIKFIRPELFAFPEMRTFFHNEARAMARVSHRNVLSVFAFGEHQGTPYFVMEYVDGRTADQWLRMRPADSFPDIDEAMCILDQACLGVEAIHATATVHRDLKPTNLLIDWGQGSIKASESVWSRPAFTSSGPRSHPEPSGDRPVVGPPSERVPESGFRVAVGDLGVARVLDSATGGNFIVGSASCMAPEAALGEDEAPELANRRDIYALGCIAYEFLTGRPPFVGKTDMSVLSQHVLIDPEPPSKVRPDLPPGFDDVVLKALAKDPLKRWPTTDAFRRALLAEYSGVREPERILIVDDDPDWLEIVATSLASRFPEAVIDRVANGEEALSAFETSPYSVVLADLQMPGIDGARLTQLLRALDDAARTPIIVLTAEGGPREWQRLSAMGADAFLVKPVNADDVELVIRRTMRSRHAQLMPPSSRGPR
ncbi:MAG: response regulator [Polyangiaceae bacterium]|nr:response regulator [Polyangiaceae bacterium]